MNLGESVSIAFEGLAANKMRAILTMLGVIIGVGAVIVTFAIAEGGRQQSMAFFQQMGTNVLMIMPGQSRTAGGVRTGFGSSQTMTLDDVEAIKKDCPTVALVAPEVRSNQQVKYGNQNTNVGVIGATPDYLEVRNYSVEEGRFFTEAEDKAMTCVATIGKTTAATLFGDASPVGKAIRIRGVQFTIVGLMAEKGAGMGGDQDDVVFIPLTTAMRRVFGTQRLRQITVQATAMDKMDQASEEITAALSKSHRIPAGSDPDFQVRNQAEFMQAANAQSDNFRNLLAGVAIVSLLVGGIGIMNIMLVSVTERTREIGIRKSIGARRKDILWQFLIEALVLSLFGGLIGIGAGVGGAYLYGYFMQTMVVVVPLAIVLSFAFAAVVGLVFGVYPSLKAASLKPIDALRYE